MTTKTERGQRRVRVTPEAIEKVLVYGTNETESNMPKDARLVGFNLDEKRWEFQFLFESAEWDKQVENEKIPEFHLELTNPKFKND